jgi:1,4-dihydroxy-2-naphthoate octaprenyltransferase
MKAQRIAYALLGGVAAVLAIGVVVMQHASWWQLLVLAIAPDVALLFGASRDLERGQLHPRAVPLYNAVHRFWVPAILIVVGVLLRDIGWMAGGLAWAAHIAFDRSLGFGLRTKEGFQRAFSP